MAVRHYNLTLTGVAQRLSSVLTDTNPGGANDEAIRELHLSADPGNAAAVYVGAASTVSSASHGFSLDPTQASQLPVKLGPYDAGAVKLSELWVLGTNTEKLHLLLIPY